MTAPGGSRTPATGLLVGILVTAIVAAAAGFAFYLLRDDPEPELTIEERLALVEGRTLTAAEVSELLDVGQAMCELDDAILDELWARLDEDQLEFQDFVFGYLCPDRSILYAANTGRYVTEEAENSGVTTSTATTTPTPASRSTTSRPTTVGPGSTGGLTTATDAGDTTTSSTIADPPTTPPAPTTTAGAGTTTGGAGDSTVTLDPGL